MTYEEWIADWARRRNGHVAHRCVEATREMVEAFPELRRVAGWCDHAGGSQEHFWCLAPDGHIIDPTAAQFVGIEGYREFQPGDTVRVGRCMNCGDSIYAPVGSLKDPKYGRSVCGEECESQLLSELNGAHPVDTARRFSATS